MNSFDRESTPGPSNAASASMSIASLGSSKRQSAYDDVEKPNPSPEPFSYSFWHRGDLAVARARATYFKTYLPGVLYVTFVILAAFAVVWGTMFKLPAHSVPGWIVDFDGGEIGQAVVQKFSTTQSRFISWEVIPSTRFPGGVAEVMRAIEKQEIWVAIAINEGATSGLESSISTPNPSYDGSKAITAFASESRNENAYRTFLLPTLLTNLDAFKTNFATQFASRFASSTNIQELFTHSPQTVVNPVSFTVVNVLPFFQPVAAPAVFTGLIFMLIVAFFMVLVANGARQASGLNRLLTFRSLITLRLGSSILVYLLLSLLYSFLNLAFKVQLSHTYGHSGFILFWMVTWIYMLAVGLVLETAVTFLKQNIPFFFLPWLIVNLSVGLYPIEMLPKIFHYGYGAPFYNISRVVRSIVFGTKDTLALNFGVLIAWVIVGSASMAATQWLARWQEIKAMQKASEATVSAADMPKGQ